MADKIENFNRSFPCGLTLENFFYRNGFDVKRFATVGCSDCIFKLRNLFRRHSLNQTPSRRYSQFSCVVARTYRLLRRGSFSKKLGNVEVYEIGVVKNDRLDRALHLVTLMTVRGDNVKDFAGNAMLVCERDAAEWMA